MTSPSPRRLIDQEGELGDLMRDASRQYVRGLDANRAWQRHLERQRRPVLGRLVPASIAFAFAACVLVIAVKSFKHNTDVVALPEPERIAPPKTLQPEPEHKPAVLDREQPKQPKPERPRPPVVSPNSAREPRGIGPNVAPPETPEQAPNQPAQTKEDCLGFARAGDSSRAASCFETQAAGSGLSAEVALYELARLRRDALGQPAQALQALDEYTRRFPNGSLNGEARFSRLELLVRAGRTQEALADSEALLGSRFGNERSAEIRLLRGNLYLRTLSDPSRAAREYEIASRGAGRIGDDAAFLLAVSLEKAGNVAAARAAYESYAARPNARRAAEAKAKATALSGQ